MPRSTRRRFLASSIALATGVSTAGRGPRLLSAPPDDGNQSYLLTTNRDPQDHHDPQLHLMVDDHEIAEQKQKMEDMAVEFGEMLKETLDRMSERIEVSNSSPVL